MNKILLKDAKVQSGIVKDVIGLAIFGSYHEKDFNIERSDIDILILLEKELDFEEEFEIEDYLDEVLKKHFKFDRIHYTFISEFNYPFSELFLVSKDKIIFQTEKFLDYTLGYSTFKRDREYLEIMRKENLNDIEED